MKVVKEWGSDPSEYDMPDYSNYESSAVDSAMEDEYIAFAIASNIFSAEYICNILDDMASERVMEDSERYVTSEDDEDGYYFNFNVDLLAEDIIEQLKEFLMEKYNIDITNIPQNESYRRKIMKEDVEIKKTKGSATAKVRKLQKQYNKILVDLFDQFAAESIEEALEGNEGSFGENINDIIQNALDNLKTKVLDELGVKSGVVGEIGIAIGGGDMADFMSGVAEELSGEEGEETEAHEEEESDAFEAGEQAAGDNDEEDEEDEDEKVEEKVSSRIKHTEGIKREQIISESRRSDQMSLTDIYTTMYKK